MLVCRLLGHRPRFHTEGATLIWACERDCGAGGSKEYPSAAAARRYAQAFDREDSSDIGKRPLLSLLPLRMARRSRDRES